MIFFSLDQLIISALTDIFKNIFTVKAFINDQHVCERCLPPFSLMNPLRDFSNFSLKSDFYRNVIILNLIKVAAFT